jgi:hypothetical protein
MGNGVSLNPRLVGSSSSQRVHNMKNMHLPLYGVIKPHKHRRSRLKRNREGDSSNPSLLAPFKADELSFGDTGSWQKLSPRPQLICAEVRKQHYI